jgi:hypothetical protein
MRTGVPCNGGPEFRLLDTTEFVSYLRSLDVRLATGVDGQLKCTAPKGVVTQELTAEMKSRKQEILDFLKERELSSPAPPIERIGRSVPLEPSSGQQQLWFLQQLDAESAAYHIGGGVKFAGKLDPGSLERSLQEIIRRHEALRTSIVEIDGSPMMLIREARDWKMTVHSLRDVPAKEREKELARIAVTEFRGRFDLAADILIRASLIAMDEDEHVLIMVIHHIAADGWSMSILGEEMARLYEAFTAGLPSPLP